MPEEIASRRAIVGLADFFNEIDSEFDRLSLNDEKFTRLMGQDGQRAYKQLFSRMLQDKHDVELQSIPDHSDRYMPYGALYIRVEYRSDPEQMEDTIILKCMVAFVLRTLDQIETYPSVLRYRII
jgi:predicted transcriptional regulator